VQIQKKLKMKKNQLIKTTLLFAFIFGFYISSGQTIKRKIIKIAPLNLVDPFGPNLLLGGEFILDENIGLELNLAGYIPFDEIFHADQPKIIDFYGIKFKPEVRYYFKARNTEEGIEKTKKFSSKYISYELFFVGKHYKKGDTFINFSEDPANEESFYAYETIGGFEIGNNAKIGYQYISVSGFTFETYIGFGIAYYNYRYIQEIYAAKCCPKMFAFSTRIGQGFRPNMTLGIKLGLAL
jgi:hypothetical protein